MSSIQPYYNEGGITIYHADALDVLPALSGCAGVVTDPPYSSGGAFRGDRMATTLTKYTSTKTRLTDFTGDNRDQRSYAAWCALWLNAARHAAMPGALLTTFSDWRQLPTLTDAVQCGGWVWRGIAVWSKKFGRVRMGGLSSACEFVAWGTNGSLIEHGAAQCGIFEQMYVPSSQRLHLAEKPLPVMRWLLQAVPDGGPILDPFMGSGTTLRAAKDLGRSAIGIEVSEENCEIAAHSLSQAVLALS